MTQVIETDGTAISKSTSEFIKKNYRSASYEEPAKATTIAKQLAAALAPASLDSSTTAPVRSEISAPVSDRIAEVNRQISRLEPYFLHLKNDKNFEELSESISATIGLLSNFPNGPIPIPMASISEEGSSLFIDIDGFYGDIEIKSGKAEYFLKWLSEDGEENEIYGEEDIDDDNIPPSLLVNLFKKFARY